MRGFVLGLSAVVLATLYAACADPPKRNTHKGSAGASGATGGATGGNEAASGGEAGDGNETSGSGASSGGASNSGGMGHAGNPAGEGGAPEPGAGEGGLGGEGGQVDVPPVDPCTLTTIGKSKLPAPPTTGVAPPSGTAGTLTVLNWAGFKGAISYTFDDALQSQIAHYDQLNAVGVPMTFYLVQGNDGSNPLWTKAAKDGHELGNHTWHHCKTDGTQCGWGAFTDVNTELDSCTAHIESAFGVPSVYTFASPNGDGNWASPASTRFLVGRGINDDPNGVVPNGTSNAFSLPCHMSSMGETATGTNGYNSVTDSARAKGSWRIILAHNVDPAINDYGYQPVQLAEIVAGMTYTKSLGDVWTDTMVSIGAYWRAQKAISPVQPVTSETSKIYSWKLPAHFPPGQYVRATITSGKLTQCGTELTWDEHGYYEINLDAGSVTLSP